MVVHSFSNNRRVLTQLRKFTDPATSQSLLLAADSMYGANVMDGKFKVIDINELSKNATTGNQTINEQFYTEVPYGVKCVEHFSL